MNYAVIKIYARQDIERKKEIENNIQKYKDLKIFKKVMLDYQKQIFTSREFEKYRAYLEFCENIYLHPLDYYRKHFPSIFKIEKIEEFPIIDKNSRQTEKMGKRYYYSVDFEAVEKHIVKYAKVLNEKIKLIKTYAEGLVEYTDKLKKEMGE